MSTVDMTARLLSELHTIDQREDKILAALLRHGARLEERELRERSVAVADLQELKAALDETLAKIARAQAGAVTPPPVETPAMNGATEPAGTAMAAIAPTPPVAPPAVPTVSELARDITANDAEHDRLRAQLAQRLQALAPLAERTTAEAAPAPPDDRGSRTPRTLRLRRESLMKGNDVRAFQRLLNEHFAALRIGRRIAENGTYGPITKEAAHQVAYCRGLLKTDLERGITPALRIVLRDLDRRTEAQKRRAGEHPCRAYRAKLRRRYAKAATPAAPTSKPHGSGAMASAGSVAAAIRAHGGRYEDIIIREAKRSGLPVALLCALVEKESGFSNVFGHDPTIFAGAGTVTKQKYLDYKKRRGPQGKGGMQGVGPCQLTWWTLQDRADRLGGCWMPGPNIRVGAAHLKSLVEAHGLADGLRRYNGDGAMAQAYSRDMLRRKAVWDARLAGRASGIARSAKPKPAPKPGGSGAGMTQRRGAGKLTARGRALHWLTTHRGITEQPLGSNRDRRADGISAAQRRIGTPVGGAWCGTWCANAALAGGVKMTQAWRWAAVRFIEDDAKARTNGFRGWTRDHRRVLRGDLVVLYGRGEHVEVVRKVSPLRKIVITDGANTSSGDGGSQTNGHGAYMRKRPFSAVHGYALVDYPDR